MRAIEISRILCPIDFSDCSRHALNHAMAIARMYHGRLTVFHAVSNTREAVLSGRGRRQPLAPAHADFEQLLGRIKAFATAQVGDEGMVECAAVETGDVAATILGQAAALRADLLVMGTHGRSGFRRLMLGSVTEGVLHRAGCPVLTVPRDVRAAAPPDNVLYRHILCGVDFSACSLEALSYAMSLAARFEASLTVAHVIELVMPPADLANVYREGVRLEQELEIDAKKRLAEVIPVAARTSLRHEELLAVGRPHEELLRLATSRGVDLIVLGVRGRGTVDCMLFGSTTQHVVRHATCPVLTLRVD